MATLTVPAVNQAFFAVTGALFAQKAGVAIDVVVNAKNKEIAYTSATGTKTVGNLDAAIALYQDATAANPELATTFAANNDEVIAAAKEITAGIFGNMKTLPQEIKKWEDKIGPDATYIFNNKLSIADIALFANVYTNGRWFSMLKQGVLEKDFVNFAKQAALFQEQGAQDESVAFVQEAFQYLQGTKATARVEKVEKSKSGSFEIDLPGAEEGKVVTRFPPEPSGYLHIGHVKALLLNDYFARRFKGKMLLRFDDTNPSKEKQEYTDNIIKDMGTLGVQWVGPNPEKPDEPSHTSDLIPQFYEYGRQLLRDGKGYVDDTPVEKMREERAAKIESAARANSVEKNLELFEEMIKGTEHGQKCCLRAKMDMSSPVGCLRDPTMFRCNTTPHPRHGTKYICYPMYDFACPIIDSLEGVTHTLRTLEYHDRNAQYEWVCNALGLRVPKIWDFSRLNFKHTLLSKRKLQWFVDNNLVEGWFDPRFPTVQGILRRGLSVETLKEFMVQQGASKNVNLMEWDKIWALNKQKLEPVCARYNAVVEQDVVPVEISDVNTVTTLEQQLHPKNKEVGVKTMYQTKTMYLEQADAAQCVEGEEVTVMAWGNMKVDKIEKNADGKVTKIFATTNLAGDVKTTKLKLTWLCSSTGAETTDDFVKLNLIEYGPLITVDKLEESMNVEDYVNRNSKVESAALGEQGMAKIKVDDVFQIQRKGFFRVDQLPTEANGNRYQLIFVPDGTARKQPGL